MHISALEAITIYFFLAAKIAALQLDKASTKILIEYFDYADIFSMDLEIELPKSTNMNKHAIELIERKQPPYRPIYALSQVELETLKTYIKTHLKTGFIQPSKFPASAFILLNEKLNDSFYLCINYQGLNNLTIKN